MSEAVTMPSLMMVTSIGSEESLARDTQADTRTNRDSGRASFKTLFNLVCFDFFFKAERLSKQKNAASL